MNENIEHVGERRNGTSNRMESVREALSLVGEVRNPRVIASLLPSAARGLFLKVGKRGEPVKMKAAHSVHFDFEYRGAFPEMQDLYRRAIENQWNAETTLDWSIDVDPLNPEVPILPASFFPVEDFEQATGIMLSDAEKQRFRHSVSAWVLSQFLHGEQGALYAAAQVTESVEWLDGKLYGSTQVMDEARHVEVFLRYLDTKLNKLYQVNDNLYVILDDLMTDARWDIKFLGMQIMVEGLALGAFGTIYQATAEPLLKNLLKYVIQDEARHVHYGVLALRKHIQEELDDKERREREDWAFEIALLMRNRFMAHEVFEEWFEGQITRKQWNELVGNSPAMQAFRIIMFKRLVPNLAYIGLLTPRMRERYERAGLMQFAGGKNASELTADDLLADLG
jgi:hypothetical protein